MLKCVMFDFDGTLADTLAAIANTARTVLADYGFNDASLGDLRRIVGPPFPYAFELVYGVSHAEAVEITEKYRAIYKTLGPVAWPLFAGVRDLLDNLRAHDLKLAIASSKRNEMLAVALHDNHLEGYFDVIAGKTDDEGHKKSDSIRYILDELQLSEDECVMVGDRKYDIEAAHAEGVRAIGVLYGKTCEREELVEAGADTICETVAELEAKILSL